MLIAIFLLLEMALVNWGTPAPGRMFAYFMDEWHGVQAIRALATQGTVNIPGAALGTPGYYAISAAWLIPPTALKLVNPWAIKNPVAAPRHQQKLFWILRASTWVWAIIGIILLKKLTQKAVWLVVFSPLWLAFSSVFKYDVPVAVGILIFIWRILIYKSDPSSRNWIWAVITTGLVTTLKFSLIPLIPWLAISWMLFTPKKNYKQLIVGIVFSVLIFLILGMPDLWLPGHLGFWREWLTMVFAEGQKQAPFYIWGKIYPQLFGLPLYLSGLLGLFFIQKNKLFWLSGFGLFTASLLTIGIGAVAGRATVLLPFLAIGAANFLAKIKSKLVVCLLVTGQLFIGLRWWTTQIKTDTRVQASIWIQANIPAGSTIGVPNIPIYQRLPDVLVNDFYGPQYQADYPIRYTIQVDTPAEYVINPANSHNYTQIAQFLSPQSRYDPIGGLSWHPTIKIYKHD